MGIRFRLLGDVTADHDGQVIDLGHARQKAVLTVLLIEANQVVSIDQLIDRVWVDRPPLRARETLYGYLHRLRRVLSPDDAVAIVRRSGGYTVTVDQEAVDLHRFAELVGRARATNDRARALELFDEALDLWRGTPFADLDTPWCASLRADLEQQRFSVELDRTDLALWHGKHAELLSTLVGRVEVRPLDERLAGQYMLALYRGGRQAEALEQYQRTRQRLVDEVGADPGPALRRLHQRMLTADPELVPAAPVATVPVPRQLPAPPWSFTDRVHEFAYLSKVFETQAGGTVAIATVSGTGGVGKTWLALHWAYQNLDRFPDGQLYADLHGFDPVGDPIAPVDVVRGFLVALGVAPASIPVDQQAQIGLYRSLLAGKRTLVMLDNARDSAQVLPLLPGAPSCAVLITSRSRLGDLAVSHGARTLSLNVLSDAETRELLAARLGRDRLAAEPEAVTEILGHCAGLPLALGIVAARADSDPALSLGALADDLRDTATRLDALAVGDLRTVFSASYRALSPAAAELFCLLGTVPGPDIGLPAAANLTTTRAAPILTELKTAHLVEEHVPKRYKMHDLLRLYAAEQQPPQPAALRRLTDFYLHTAYAAERLMHPHRAAIDIGEPGVTALAFTDEDAALTWLDTEYFTLVASQSLAAQHEWHDRVWRLAWSLDTFHRRRGHVHGQLAMWLVGLAAAQHGTDPTPLAIAHRNLGIACIRTGRHAEALEHLEQALELARQTGDVAGEGHNHLALAYAWEHQQDDRRALEHARNALAVFGTLDHPVWAAQALTQAGLYLARLGHDDEADASLHTALSTFRNHQDRDGEAETLANLGYTAHHAGRHQVAIDYYRQALALRRELGHAYARATTLDRLGQIHTALDQHTEATAVWRQALDLYRAQHRATEAEEVENRLRDNRSNG